ncbi:SusC/RagA family TonB-linked outer membrane protein [Bacteroidia bacterium]|nr:SusC/RagA family TonB-linked outer membrane protein [Bacteroidia bacterium]
MNIKGMKKNLYKNKRVMIFLSLVFLMINPFLVKGQTLDKEITFELQDKSLDEGLQLLGKISGFKMSYSSQLLLKHKNVSVEKGRRTVEATLDLLLANTNLTARIQDSRILIVEKENDTKTDLLPSKVISGKVTDGKGESLPGVSVKIKNTAKGTVTDNEGNFLLESESDETLVFLYVGFQSLEIMAGRISPVTVLKEKTEELSDVVITGIYTRNKESFTGSSSTYSQKELKMVGNQNVLQSVRTLDPSFAIIENNQFGSDPNRLMNIEIRGKSSVIGLTEDFGTDPNQPLFILDGFETTLATVSDLSMDRVESITLLKDAASTAIYGSKAANGVVVIETRKPEYGKLKLNYNGNYSFTWADLSDYNLMNSMEKLTFERLSGAFGLTDANGNLTSNDYETYYYNTYREVLRGVDTYWLAEPLRFAVVNKQNLFVEGGDNYLRYGVGLSYSNTQGVMKGSERNVINGNVRLMYRRGSLAINNNFNVDNTVADHEPVAFSKFSRANPYFRKYDENGEPQMVLSSDRYSAFNPLWDMKQNSYNRKTDFAFTNQFELDWNITEDLRTRVRLGISKDAGKGIQFVSPKNSTFSGVATELKGNYTESNNDLFKYDGETSLIYGKLFGAKHRINAVGGFKLSEDKATNSEYIVAGFMDDMLTRPSAAMQYKPGTLPAFSDEMRRTASFFLNTSYSYYSRYLFDVNYRSDGSSVFGTDRHFANTWSMGVAWNLHNESFIKDYISGINTLKLRFSIGNPGNQNFSDYISVRLYGYNFGNANPFGSSMSVSTFGNEGLEWQKTLDRNYGLDLVVLNNRLRLNMDYFDKKTDPLLVYIGVPTSTGVSKVPRNLALQLTRGSTLTANYSIIKKENLMLSANVNMRHITSVYQGMGDALKKFNLENQGSNLTRYYDGGSPTDIWAVRSLGIDPGTGREVFLTKDGNETFLHNYDDEVVVGNTEPKVEGTFGSSFYYKGFTASFNFRYRIGGQIFMKTLYDKVENISDRFQNQDKRALYDRWQKPGDNAKFRSISINESAPMSSRFVMDNNILSGESISLGYESDAPWLRRVGASAMTVRGYMNDIFRFSTVKNERGIDYPFSRSFSLSLGFRF